MLFCVLFLFDDFSPPQDTTFHFNCYCCIRTHFKLRADNKYSICSCIHFCFSLTFKVDLKLLNIKGGVHRPYCSIGKVPTNLEPLIKMSIDNIYQLITFLKMCNINERKCMKLTNSLGRIFRNTKVMH